MTASKPTLTIIAEPNGAGKSTFTRVTQEALLFPVIDPDREVRLLRPDNPEAAAFVSGKQVIKRAHANPSKQSEFCRSACPANSGDLFGIKPAPTTERLANLTLHESLYRVARSQRQLIFAFSSLYTTFSIFYI